MLCTKEEEFETPLPEKPKCKTHRIQDWAIVMLNQVGTLHHDTHQAFHGASRLCSEKLSSCAIRTLVSHCENAGEFQMKYSGSEFFCGSDQQVKNNLKEVNPPGVGRLLGIFSACVHDAAALGNPKMKPFYSRQQEKADLLEG